MVARVRRSEEESDKREKRREAGEGRTRSGGAVELGAVLAVVADAASVGHHVGDVVLLVDAVQQVGHGASRKHGHVLAAVRLGAERNRSLGLVVVFLWTQRERFSFKVGRRTVNTCVEDPLPTVVDVGDVLPPAIDDLVTWSVSIQDGGEGLLVHVAHNRGQACGWRRRASTAADQRRAAPPPTKYVVASVGVAAEVEDVRVIGGDHGQGVVDAGQETGPADGSVHFHRFVQGLLGLALVVAVVNTPPWNRRRGGGVFRTAAANVS